MADVAMIEARVMAVMSALGSVPDVAFLVRLVVLLEEARNKTPSPGFGRAEVLASIDLLLEDDHLDQDGSRICLGPTHTPGDSPSAGDRALVHSHTAQLLAERGASSAEIAQHGVLGVGDEDWLIPHLRAEAERRFGEGELADAEVALRRAASIAAAVERAPHERSNLLIDLALVEAGQGRPDALDRLERNAVADIARSDLRSMAGAVRAAELLYSTGRIDAARAIFARALEALEASADSIGEVREHIEARLLAGLSTTSLLLGTADPVVAARLAAVADEPPPRPDLPTRALMAVAAGQIALGVDQPIHITRRLLDGALGPDVARSNLVAVVHRPLLEPVAAALAAVGRVRDSERLLTRLGSEGRTPFSPQSPSVFALRAYSRLLLGDLVGADEDARHATELVAGNPALSQIADPPARFVIAAVAIEREDVDGAMSAIDVPDHAERWSQSAMYAWFLHGQALVAAASGDHPSAVETWRAAEEVFTTAGSADAFCELRLGLARSLMAIGDGSGAERVTDAMIAAAKRGGDDRSLGLALVTSARATEDTEQSVTDAEVAVKLLRNTEADLDRCWTLIEAAGCARRAGRRSRARSWLAEAGPLAQRIGSARAIKAVGDEFELLGQRRVGASRWDLTPGERRVAELASAGKTNREISAALNLSVKTVESHLSSTYRKLGIRSRRSLAAKLAP